MLSEAGGRLTFFEVGGTPYEIGVQLGRHARGTVERYLLASHAWASVMAFRDDPRIRAAKALTEARFPRYWQELQGLAAGLGLPFDDVFAWNCRGDVDRKSVVSGKSVSVRVDLGGCRIIKTTK